MLERMRLLFLRKKEKEKKNLGKKYSVQKPSALMCRVIKGEILEEVCAWKYLGIVSFTNNSMDGDIKGMILEGRAVDEVGSVGKSRNMHVEMNKGLRRSIHDMITLNF